MDDRSSTQDRQRTAPSRPEGLAAALRHALLPLNGLRAIATVLVMVFHHLRLRRHFGSDALNEAFRRNPVVIHAMLKGFIGLEVLFVLCGFLATIALVPLLEDHRRPVKQAVLLYYWRRAARIAPAHWVSLLLAYFAMLRGRELVRVPEATGTLLHYPPEDCPRGLWVQAAFLGHVQYGGGCSMQLWSQGTQAAFWGVAPLLMAAAGPRRPGFRSRVACIAGVLIVLSTAFRAWAAWRHNIQLPIPAFGSHLEHDNVDFRQYQFYLHYPLLCRAASLAVGCLTVLPFLDARSWQAPVPTQCPAVTHCQAAAVQQHNYQNGSQEPKAAGSNCGTDAAATNGSVISGVKAAFSKPFPQMKAIPRMVAVLGASLTLLALHGMATIHVWKPAGDPVWPRAQSLAYLVFMAQGGAVSSAAIAFIMAVATTGAGPARRVLRLLLGGASWKLLSDLSYSVYLYHIQTRFWVWRYGLLPSGLAKSAGDLGAFAIDMAVCVPATIVVAAVSYHLVERPPAAVAKRLEPWLFSGSRSSGGDGDSILAAGTCKIKAI